MLNEIIFLILAAIILVGALKMLTATELVHAVVYLGLVLAGVAGIFLTLSAEFLAAIQILVYVGAVVTLILFAVMLTTPAPTTEGYGEDKTPLSMLGFDAPRGMDVESLTEAPEDATSVSEAEAAAGAAAGAAGSASQAEGEDREPPAHVEKAPASDTEQHVEGVSEPGELSAEDREAAAEDDAEPDDIAEEDDAADEPETEDGDEDDEPETEEPTDTAADEAADPDEKPAKAGDEEDA